MSIEALSVDHKCRNSGMRRFQLLYMLRFWLLYIRRLLMHPPDACAAEQLLIPSFSLLAKGEIRHQEIQQPVYHPLHIMCTPCDTNNNYAGLLLLLVV
jgi:hypothetical protein